MGEENLSMTRAILVAFHRYQPYGAKYYEPIYQHFIKQMESYKSEFDKLYFLDSNWEIPNTLPYAEVIRVSPHLRYYDAYKAVLPQIKEDKILLMDNDMIVYKTGIINNAFSMLTLADVVSIYDTIGTMKVNLPNGKNKFCPYWFATRKDTLMKYLNIDWSPDAMPYTETFGLLTEAMLKDGLVPYEFEEDKTSCLFEGANQTKGKDLGYYHIRSGSLPAVLLAYYHHDPDKFLDYITHQPKNEYLRQFFWFWFMGGDIFMDPIFLRDLGVKYTDWLVYVDQCRKFYGLL